MYTATQWSTVQDKEKFVRQFIKFVTKGFRFCDFPKWFYIKLSNCFGHIAHYNQGGFYETFFQSTQDKAAFVQHCLEADTYGSPAFTFCDVEKELQQWLKDNKFLEKLERQAHQEQEDEERKTLARLQAKYGDTKKE